MGFISAAQHSTAVGGTCRETAGSVRCVVFVVRYLTIALCLFLVTALAAAQTTYVLCTHSDNLCRCFCSGRGNDEAFTRGVVAHIIWFLLDFSISAVTPWTFLLTLYLSLSFRPCPWRSVFGVVGTTIRQ